jgi:uncharacterized protein YggT (Ycf19 family)
MALINFILNLAGLLLWLGWRDARTDALTGNPTVPLARTLRPLGKSSRTRWKYLGALVTLLLARALFYHWIGPAVKWTARLDLVTIALPFQSELLWRMWLYSLFSFGLTLGMFYLAILFFSLVNRPVPDTEPLQKVVRGFLGRVDRWPAWLKLLLPLTIAAGLCLLMSPLLVRWEIIPAVPALGVRFRQGLLIGAGLCLVWKHVAGVTLLLYFLNSHIYFGRQPLWSFVTVTARRLLSLLRWLPVRIGRVDLAPVVGIVLIYLFSHLAEEGLHRRHASEPDKVLLPGLVDLFRWTS